MRIQCPAKINLHLRIGKRRADGFHLLLTWMTTVGLFDTLTISNAPAGASAGSLTLSCDVPNLPADASNLIVRAADAFRRATGRENLPAVAASLEKKVPFGAGLGGGSSDAARTLLALDRLWQINWPVEQLSAVASTLGSDVPFFLHDVVNGASCICTGRGEIVNPVSRPQNARWAMLVLPDIHMPTPAVYRRFDELGLGFDDEIDRPANWSNWAQLPTKEFLRVLVNDLEAPAFEICPDLAKLRAGIEMKLSRPVRMSGSGSSLFTLFDSEDEAAHAARNISDGLNVRAIAAELAPSVADDLKK